VERKQYMTAATLMVSSTALASALCTTNHTKKTMSEKTNNELSIWAACWEC
jgi:hypothetical protein